MKPSTYRFIITTALAAGAALLLPACATQRTVLGTRPGKVQIAGRENDEKAIREKFTNRGYSIDKEGNIQADKKNLYTDSTSSTGKKTFRGTKDARVGGREPFKKAYKTPEYLKRSTFKEGNKKAREGGMFARDSGNQAYGAKKGFANKNARLNRNKTSYASKQFRNKNKMFATASNRTATRAQASAPIADGIQRTAGLLDKAALSVDDVKKMLNPNAYANAKGL